MIRRALGLAVIGICLLSLLASAAAGWLWWRSARRPPPHVRFRFDGEWRTVRSDPDGLRLLQLPRGDPKRQQALREWLAQTDNRFIVWDVALCDDDPTFDGAVPGPAEGTWDPADYGLRFGDDAVTYRPLVEALDDPTKFAAAHVLLSHVASPAMPVTGPHWGSAKQVGRRVIVRWNGLEAALPQTGAGWRGDLDSLTLVRYTGPAPGYDPGQMTRLRNDWYDRLERPVVSVPHWAVVAAAACPWMLWLATRGRRRLAVRRRRQRGLCARCGYDLRGSPGSPRCSECGAEVWAKGPS